ncbi:hypothetical protein [Flavobacterium salmonis]|uniref:Uncharacterized protein n=1 Tax=Flavobacterium salmonis TaxID=2654844 RepID=A0A6V6YNB8_9FLAO|nr:hypothetical protein [Flavobacterium salmonis]CAD0000824.1 hypothetical protein FLAT13_00236 [Flavobacterium salmonis]
MQKTAYLNPEEIQLVKLFNSKNKIVSIFYYYWINISNPDEHYSFIDVIEFVFDDNKSLFFKLNEDDSGIGITTEFEFEKYKKSLQTEFLQQIRLQKVEATTLEIWESALITAFQQITFIEEKGNYLNVMFCIEFKNQKIELHFHPVEGLVVSEYDEISE